MGGVGDAGILKSETGGAFAPSPVEIPPTVQCMGEPEERAGVGEGLRMHGRGGGCRHIEIRDRRGLLPPPPWRYPPRSSVWENLKKGPAQGRTSECMGGVGDAGILKSETGGGFCPLPLWRYPPRSSVWGYALGTAFPRVSPRLLPAPPGGCLTRTVSDRSQRR